MTSAREAHTVASAIIVEDLEEMRQKEEQSRMDTAELMRKLEEKYPVSADILALKGSLRLSSAEPNVDAIRYEYLREKYGL